MAVGVIGLHRFAAVALSCPLLALMAPAAAALAPGGGCGLDGVSHTERPGREAGPTPVEIGLFLLDLVEVTDRRQSFTADFNLNLRWRDPRLARPGDESGSLCIADPQQIWTPRIRLVNERDLKRRFEERLLIDADGNVRYDQRYFGEMTSRADLSDFPLDERELVFMLAAVDNLPGDIAFSPNELRTGRVAELSVANWAVGEQSFSLLPFQALEDLVFAGVTFSFPARRTPGYYVWNTIVPLVLIVLMSWTVFWVNPAHLGPQIGLAATSMLSLIAYRFTLSGVLPPVSYFTRMDFFLTGGSFLVFLALVEAVTTSGLADRGREAAAARIDALARVAFPLSFGAIALYAFGR